MFKIYFIFEGGKLIKISPNFLDIQFCVDIFLIFSKTFGCFVFGYPYRSILREVLNKILYLYYLGLRKEVKKNTYMRTFNINNCVLHAEYKGFTALKKSYCFADICRQGDDPPPLSHLSFLRPPLWDESFFS